MRHAKPQRGQTVITGPAWDEVLRALRQQRGLSQDVWAARLGYGRRTLRRSLAGFDAAGLAGLEPAEQQRSRRLPAAIRQIFLDLRREPTPASHCASSIRRRLLRRPQRRSAESRQRSRPG